MTTDNTFPLGLVKANLELHLRTVQLLHEHGQRWLDMSSRVSKEGIEEYKSEIGNLNHTGNWQTLAVLPAEAFWRQLQQRFADTQNATQLAIETQSAFTQGMQKAVQAWQKSAVGNIDTAGTGLPFTDFIKSWGAHWSAAATDKKGGSRAS